MWLVWALTIRQSQESKSEAPGLTSHGKDSSVSVYRPLGCRKKSKVCTKGTLFQVKIEDTELLRPDIGHPLPVDDYSTSSCVPLRKTVLTTGRPLGWQLGPQGIKSHEYLNALKKGTDIKNGTMTKKYLLSQGIDKTYDRYGRGTGGVTTVRGSVGSK